MHNIQIERLRRLPVRREVWEVAAGPLAPVMSPEPGGRPEQFLACVCVSGDGQMCMADPQPERAFAPSAGLDAFARLALDGMAQIMPEMRALNYLPSSVTIGEMPQPAREALSAALHELGIEVELKIATPRASAVLGLLGAAVLGHLEGLDEGPIEAPGLARGKGMTVERIAAFADAAAGFWKAAPWRLSGAEILWEISPAPKTRGMTHVTVMGALGEQFGLGFLAGGHELMVMAESDEPLGYFKSVRRTLWSVTFEPGAMMPGADAELWEKHGLAAAADEAGERMYPLPLGAAPGGRAQRPTAENLTVMESVLRAFAGMKRKDMQEGAFERDVETFEGVRRVGLVAVMGG